MIERLTLEKLGLDKSSSAHEILVRVMDFIPCMSGVSEGYSGSGQERLFVMYDPKITPDFKEAFLKIMPEEMSASRGFERIAFRVLRLCGIEDQ